MESITPPCYAVIFSSQRTADDPEGYAAAAARMDELARSMPGFLGVESARGADGFGVTISYWDSEESIAHWRRHAEHLQAQAAGRASWYSRYHLRICCVERVYGFGAGLS